MKMAPQKLRTYGRVVRTVKREPVVAVEYNSPKQEIDYTSVKGEPLCLLEWNVPDGHISIQDPLSTAKEECSASENVLEPSTSNIEKTEDEEDDDMVVSDHDDLEECSASENVLEPSTSNIEKTEDEEDDDMVVSDHDDLEVVAVEFASPTQEIDYIIVKGEPLCLLEWDVPDGHISIQDPLSTAKEECSASENVLEPSTSNIKKTEDEEDAAAVSDHDDDWEECSASENVLEPSTSNIEKTEDEEDAAAVGDHDDDWEELKHDVQSESSGSDPESSNPVGIEDDNSNHGSDNLVTNASLAARTGNRIQHTTKREAFCEGKRGTRHLVYSCGFCKKTFAQLQHLKEHKHIMTYKQLNSCSVCHKTFTKRSVMLKHFRVHLGERLHSCQVWQNKLTCMSNLNKHLRVHNG